MSRSGWIRLKQDERQVLDAAVAGTTPRTLHDLVDELVRLRQRERDLTDELNAVHRVLSKTTRRLDALQRRLDGSP